MAIDARECERIPTRAGPYQGGLHQRMGVLRDPGEAVALSRVGVGVSRRYLVPRMSERF